MTRRATGGWWRSPLVGTAIVVSMLALTSCGDDDAATTAAPATAVTTTTISGTSPTAPITPTMSDAIAAVGTRYRFTAVVSVGGVVANHVEGAVFDGTGQYLVTSGASTVEYVVGPTGQWARTGEGPWAVLGGPAPVADPLSPLNRATAVTVVSSEGNDAVLDAVYPASELGFSGTTGDITVTITIQDGVLVELRYTAPVGADEALVVTTIDAAPDMTAITTPTL